MAECMYIVICVETYTLHLRIVSTYLFMLGVRDGMCFFSDRNVTYVICNVCNFQELTVSTCTYTYIIQNNVKMCINMINSLNLQLLNIGVVLQNFIY